MQSPNVNSTFATLTALGGTGGTGAAGTGGDGGDGRARVDGLRSGTTTIEGIIGGYGGSQFVGPAITSTNSSYVVGRGATGAPDPWVEAKIWNGTAFNNFTSTVDANGDFAINVSYSPGANYITVIQNTTNSIFVMSSAATWIMHALSMEDSATADDQIFAKAKMNLEDSATVDDFITKRVFIMLIDGAMLDAVTITDQISAFTSIDTLRDSTLINDEITFTVFRFRTVEDTVDIDDSISFKAFIRLNDGVRGDSVTVEDLISAKSIIIVESEGSASLDDFITPVVLRFRTVEDTVDVDDSISFKAFIRLNDGARGDSVTIADIVSKKVSIKIEDSASIDDFIFAFANI